MKPNIIFLSNLPCFWDAVRTVYENFLEDKSFNVWIVAQNCDFFAKKGISVIDNQNGKFDLNRLNPTIIFREVPYCEQLPYNFRIDSLINLRSMPKICYVSYGSDFLPPTAGSSFFYKHPFFDYCWKIFVSTKQIQKAHSLLYPSHIAKKKFIVSGIPKLDVYLENKNNVTEPTWKLKKTNSIKRIIWTAHWSISHVIYEDNSVQNNYSKGFSTFLLYKDYFLEIAQKYQNLDIVLRPHPSLFHHLLTYNHMTQKEIEDYKTKIFALNNMNIFSTLTQDYFDLFLSSDALISDFSATLSEYLPTKKPILFLKRQDAPKLGEWFDNNPPFYNATTKFEIEEFIKSVVIKGNDPLYNERLATLKKYLYIPKGGSGKFIKEYIAKELNKKHNNFYMIPNNSYYKYEDMYLLNFKRLLQTMHVNTIIDIECGNSSPFYSFILNSNILYLGLDRNPELIIEKKNWFSSYENMKFEVMDVTTNALPQADLIYCKNTSSFLTEPNIWKLLINVVNSKSKFLIIEQINDHTSAEKNSNELWQTMHLPSPLFIQSTLSNITILCWETRILNFYISILSIEENIPLPYKKIIFEKIFFLLEEIRCSFGINVNLFVQLAQSFFHNKEHNYNLLFSTEIKSSLSTNMHKKLMILSMLFYENKLNKEIMELFPEIENKSFEVAQNILKHTLNKYAHGL